MSPIPKEAVRQGEQRLEVSASEFCAQARDSRVPPLQGCADPSPLPRAGRAHAWHGLCALLKVAQVDPVAQEAPGSCARAGHLTGASHGAAAPCPAPAPRSASSSSPSAAPQALQSCPGTARVGSPPVLFPLSSRPGGTLTWSNPSCPGLLQGALCPCALIQSPVSAGPRGSSLLLFNIKNNHDVLQTMFFP